jgi:SOS-response transcriptional repressor LexA
MKTTEKVLLFIAEYIRAHSWPPTRREIGEGLGICTTAANYHVQKLAKEGRIKIVPRTARGIVLDGPK